MDGRLIVLSPHLDDAVFSCGALLAMNPGAVVVTVFAGVPDARQPGTQWDARCGFRDGATAMAARRDEDRRALARLDAQPVWLDFLDSQYGCSPAVTRVAQALVDALQRWVARSVAFPLGLFHSDHRLVHEAWRASMKAGATCESLAYEDSLYRGMPGVLQRRLAELAQARVVATPARLPPATPQALAAKAEAIQSYASQLRAFGPGGYRDTAQPERYWRLDMSAREAEP